MLSERAKNWLVGPKALIVVAAIIGLIGWGGRGLLIGAVGGFLLTVVIGVIVRRVSGGMIPRKEREKLAVNVMENSPEIVDSAYPDLTDEEQARQLEGDVERIIEEAVDISPSNEEVWSEGVIMTAAKRVAFEQDEVEKQGLYLTIRDQIAKDWYPIS